MTTHGKPECWNDVVLVSLPEACPSYRSQSQQQARTPLASMIQSFQRLFRPKSSRNTNEKELVTDQVFLKPVTESLGKTGLKDSIADKSRVYCWCCPGSTVSRSCGVIRSGESHKWTQLHEVVNLKLYNQTFLMCQQNLRTKSKGKLLDPGSSLCMLGGMPL